jgi:hypothetical protein
VEKYAWKVLFGQTVLRKPAGPVSIGSVPGSGMLKKGSARSATAPVV